VEVVEPVVEGEGEGEGEVKNCMLSFGGDLKVRDHLKDVVVDRLIILKRILQKCEVRF